jgi:hypothetical protein
MVVGFSWWHVNFLGVGLHNYGFAAEKVGAVYAFYAVMWTFILWGGIACWLEKRAKKEKAPAEVKETVEA